MGQRLLRHTRRRGAALGQRIGQGRRPGVRLQGELPSVALCRPRTRRASEVRILVRRTLGYALWTHGLSAGVDQRAGTRYAQE
jgi:uncharacterized protein (DUF3084 family)